MGVDIFGWVEVREPYHSSHMSRLRWNGAINIRALVNRNYTMFGLLFGVRNNVFGFSTPFAHRGIPDDRSFETWAMLRYESEDESDEQILADAINASWLTWREIQSLDWDGKLQGPQSRVPVDWGALEADPNYEYTEWEDDPDDHGFQVIARRRKDDPAAMWESFYRVNVKMNTNAAWRGISAFLDKQRYVFRIGLRTVRDDRRKDPGWDVLFKLMATLAEVYGEDGVRLVAWFDQQ